MRWVSYDAGAGPRCGRLIDGTIYGAPPETRLIDLLGDDGERFNEAGEAVLADPREVREVASVRLLPPVQPRTVRDFACFIDHLRQSPMFADSLDEDGQTCYEKFPCFALKPPHVLGANDPVRMSPGTAQFDFELSVGAIVGRSGTDIAPEDAHRHIAGFTIFNDWSARDLFALERKAGLGGGKGKDAPNTLGPALVTPDEVAHKRKGHSYDLLMRAWVGEDQVSEGSLSQMFWSFEESLAYASRGIEVQTGDVMASGTVPTGCLIEHVRAALAGGERPRPFLQPGDVVTLEVEELGAIRQEVLPANPVHRLRTGH